MDIHWTVSREAEVTDLGQAAGNELRYAAVMIQEKWLRRAFRVAAVYNICWGTATAFYPNLFFEIFGLPPINYPFVMSGLGMCIALYGYGYWVVAEDLRRYPALVVIGFLGKTIGPAGWLWTVISTGLPLRTMWTNVFNDLIWLPFFVAYFVWYRRQASTTAAAITGGLK